MVILWELLLLIQIVVDHPPPPPSPNVIRTTLQADGSFPLKVTGLTGQLAEPQKARATLVTALPPLNSPLAQSGTLIAFNSGLYFFDTSTNPGTWQPVSGFITDINSETGPSITLAAGSGITVTTTSPNNIEIAATSTGDPAWTSFTPTVTSSAGAITTSTLEAKYVQTGKTVKFFIFWTGQVSLASLDINFTTPVNPVNITNFQMAPVLYQSSAAPFRLVAACAAFIDDASNKFICRSTADFPATTNFNLVLEGVYQSA